MGKEIVEMAVSTNHIIGEGPHWDPVNKVLYFVDIDGKTVTKYNPESGKVNTVKIEEGTVSFVVPLKGQKDKYVIGVGRKFVVMTWDGVSETPSDLEVITTVDAEGNKTENRLNDGKADSSGRVWAGTMGKVSGSVIDKNKGTLFSLTPNKPVEKHIADVSCSNGLTWTSDNKTMYYIDSFTWKIEAFDFDLQRGVITNRHTIFDYKANNVNGLPDGMTIDTNGNLWIACFGGSQVIQIDPIKGKLLKTIPLPSPNITSVAFGGPNLDILYVTSACVDLSDEEKQKYPTAGYVYCIKNSGAKGLPMNEAVLHT